MRAFYPALGEMELSAEFEHTTYIRDLERELRALLKEGDEARIIRFVKEKALASYRNGLDAVSLRVDQAAQKLERSVRASSSYLRGVRWRASPPLLLS